MVDLRSGFRRQEGLIDVAGPPPTKDPTARQSELLVQTAERRRRTAIASELSETGNSRATQPSGKVNGGRDLD